MTEELLLDGQKVDLKSGTNVTLNYKSNLLGDISGIESSYSQTIKLPKTNHNRAVLDNPTAPSYNSAFRRVRHSAQYRRNGIQIVRVGYAVLLDSGDDYEVAIYWGIKAQLQSWLDEDGRLADFGWEPTAGNKVWSNTHALTKYSVLNSTTVFDGFVWADYDCGLGTYNSLDEHAKALIALHPFVSALTLMRLIADKAGIATWNVSDDIIKEINKTIVFLSTRNTTEASTYEARALNNGMTFSMASSSFFTVTTSGKSVFKVTYDGTAKLQLVGTFVSLYNSVTFKVYKNGALIYSETLAYTSAEEYDDEIKVSDFYKYKYTYTVNLNLAVECNAEDELYITNAGFILNPETTETLRFFFTPPVDSEPIDLKDDFKASDNMPDISQLDFLKAICAMYGVYVMPDGPDGLQFCTLQSLTGNRENAVDWSDKLVWGGVPCEPAETRFSLDDYARHNYFKYKEDDDVETDGDGDMVVNDETLEDEHDVIELPFAPTDPERIGDVTGCIIPHYEWDNDTETQEDEDGNEVEVTIYNAAAVDVSERICTVGENSGGYCVAMFNPIKFSNLLQHYAELNAMLNDAVVIKETFRLTEFDLMELDFLKPVYLRQYGRYYGIVSIQTKDETCEVELAQLPFPTE